LKKQFSLYTLIGVFNTGIHWIVFAIFYSFDFSQAASNLFGFVIASLFSFIINSKFTFQAQFHLGRYLTFMLGMAAISLCVGYLGDLFALQPVVTLVAFSLVSLIIGFFWSKLVVLKI